MEGDDDEIEHSDCHPRLLEDVQSVHVVYVIAILCARANLPRRLFESGIYFTQHLQLCGVYSRVASISGNTVFSQLYQ